jgi:hypothetical protein
MNIKLTELDAGLKNFLFYYLVTVIIGILVGLIFLGVSSEYTPEGTVEHIRASEAESDFDIPEKYPKAAADLLITTHNHILGFAFIILSVGLIFYFNSIIKGVWKYIIMIEPLISSVVTFGSIWLVRFVDPGFIWLTIASSLLLYLFLFVMIFVCMYELKFKKSGTA